MTLSALGTTAVYYGLGSPGPFPLEDHLAHPILFQNDSEIVVETTDLTGEYDLGAVLLTLNVDYTLTGAGLPTPGAVTLTDPLPLDTLIVIRRHTPKTQNLDLQFGGDLSLEDLEAELDKLTRITQELGEENDRSLMFSATETALIGSRSRIVPPPLTGRVLGWNAAGQLENMVPSGAAGPAGAAGPRGRPVPGPVGLEGDQGVLGPPGRRGAIGQTGSTGATGARGRTGIRGPEGDQGDDGAIGPQGRRGVQGAASTVPGPTGVRGKLGPVGPSGEDGEAGDRIPGRRGLQGIQGIQGIPGSAGGLRTFFVQGGDGDDGDMGVPGKRGAPGVAGSPGAQGPTGRRVFLIQGTDGEDGNGSAPIGPRYVRRSGDVMTGNLTVPFLFVRRGGGSGAGTDEGGEIQLEAPAASTVLAGNVIVDIFQNSFRALENGGNFRGFAADLSRCGGDSLLRTEQFSILTADFTGTNVATAQPIFSSAQDVFTALAATTYAFEALYYITRAAGAVSHTTSVLFGGTATFTSIDYLAQVSNPTGNALSNVQQIMSSAATAVVLTAANTSATENLMIKLRGTIRINATGTVIPQFIYSVAPGGVPTIKRNTFFRLWPLGLDTTVLRGSWT